MLNWEQDEALTMPGQRFVGRRCGFQNSLLRGSHWGVEPVLKRLPVPLSSYPFWSQSCCVTCETGRMVVLGATLNFCFSPTSIVDLS